MHSIEYDILVPASTQFPFELKPAFTNVKIHFTIYPKSDFTKETLPSKENRVIISVRYKEDISLTTHIVPLSHKQFKEMLEIEPTMFHGESIFVPLDFKIQTKEIINAFARLSRDTLVYIIRNEDFEYHSGDEIRRRLKKYFKVS